MRTPGLAQVADPAHGAGEGLHAAAQQRLLDERLLAAGDQPHGERRDLEAARAQEVAYAVLAHLAVDVLEVVALDVERPLCP